MLGYVNQLYSLSYWHKWVKLNLAHVDPRLRTTCPMQISFFRSQSPLKVEEVERKDSKMFTQSSKYAPKYDELAIECFVNDE